MDRRSFLRALGALAVTTAIPFASPPVPPSVDKIAMIRLLMENAVAHHNNLIEEAIYRVSISTKGYVYDRA